MRLYTIDTGFFKLDGGGMFGAVPKVIWSRTNPADKNNLCSWAMRSLLIEDGDRLILIDNGIGDKQDDKFLIWIRLGRLTVFKVYLDFSSGIYELTILNFSIDLLLFF